VSAYLGLGSNLEPRLEYLRHALSRLNSGPIVVGACSSIFETEPVGFRAQPDFLNLVCQVSTGLGPEALLTQCRRIESEVGRKPTFKNGPREIDIDLLIYGDVILDLPELKVPHPAMPNRRFVLEPLAQIAPGGIDPRSGRTFAQLLLECGDRSSVMRRFESSSVFDGGSGNRSESIFRGHP